MNHSRKIFSSSGDDIQTGSSKKKTRSVVTGVSPQLGPRRTKSGSKLIDDSLKLNKRNNSLRTESMMKQLSNISSGSLGVQQVDPNDRFKNYKAGKLSQEFYHKTLNLASHTMDRNDLNRSINKKQVEVGKDRGLNSSSGAITIGSNEKTLHGILGRSQNLGLQSSGDSTTAKREDESPPLKANPLIVHKRTNTGSEILSQKIEAKQIPALSLTGHSFQKSSILSNLNPPPRKDKQVERPPSQEANKSGTVDTKTSSAGRVPSANTKEKRITQFYHDRRGVIPGGSKDSESLGATNVSIDSKKSKASKPGDSKKKPQGKVYHFIESIKRVESQLPPFEQAKTVVKEFDSIKAFSVNTHQGTVRAYNEDRVSILLNAQQRFDNLVNSQVKSCSMFAIYDGHGGSDCCNFLKENLHSYVLSNYNDKDVRGSIKTSCLKLDTDFFKKARNEFYCDTSGSCALALLVIGKLD